MFFPPWFILWRRKPSKPGWSRMGFSLIIYSRFIKDSAFINSAFRIEKQVDRAAKRMEAQK